MSDQPKLPDFNQFSRWLASRLSRTQLKAERYEELHSAALAARDEFIEARRQAARQSEGGKAIGTLPAGIEISAADFAQGKVKLEAPDSLK